MRLDLVWRAPLFILLGLFATATPQSAGNPLLMDMVHNNPGEKPFETHYNDPARLKELGYGAKTFELFESAQFGIDWSSVDPDIFPAGSPEWAWLDAKAAELDRLYFATKAAGLNVYCQTDMVVLPKRLVEKYQLGGTFGLVSHPVAAHARKQPAGHRRLDASQLTIDEVPAVDQVALGSPGKRVAQKEARKSGLKNSGTVPRQLALSTAARRVQRWRSTGASPASLANKRCATYGTTAPWASLRKSFQCQSPLMELCS